MSNLVGSVADDFVPPNFVVLYDTYASFVTKLVTRYNRVQANFEDLLQHVWMKLVEVDVIGKYHASNSLPQKMTAIEACAYLGISWQSWKKALHRHLIGKDLYLDRLRSVSKETKSKVLRRDHGVCHRCGRDMIKFAKALDDLRHDPLRAKGFKKALQDLDLSAKQKTFWYAERKGEPLKSGLGEVDRYQTTCFLCLRKYSPPVVRSKSDWAPTPIEGTWASKKAYYSRESIERFRMEREFQGNHKGGESYPKVRSKPFFKLYLARSVHNIYANWCRTRSRRYKEHFPGTDPETGRSWEDTLTSNLATQDILAELHEAVNLLIESNSEGVTKTHEEVIALLAKGCSPEEIVVRLGLPRRGLKTLLPGS